MNRRILLLAAAVSFFASCALSVRCSAQTTNAVPQTQQQSQGWLSRVHQRVAAHDLDGAQKIIDARLVIMPDDSEALGWRAQLLAWTGRRADAEVVYRRALQLSPRDGDFLLGLATVLAQENRNSEALALLDAALQIPPARADVLVERGRVLAAMGRRSQARADFLRARALEPANIPSVDDTASAGLRSLDSVEEFAPRYEVNFTNETDTFNYTKAANAQTVVFVARPNTHWILSAEGDSYQRFGANAQKFLAAATYRLTPSDALTIAGGAGNAQGIIPRAETYFEYGHGFRLSETAALPGVEASYNQHWLWYQGAHILVLTGTVAADLARDFRWTLSVNGARSGFGGWPVAWEPSGYTRLDFPLPRVHPARFLPNLTFAVGSENFSEVDQVSAFASRTYGGGFRWGFTGRQYANFYFARQFRNGGNTEGIYGASYGVRF